MTGIDPVLSATTVADVVERVAATPGARARLAGYLLEHPDALTSGHSRPPKVVGAFIAGLVAAGSTVLVVPRCAGCGSAVELPHTRGPDERICGRCWRRNHTAECVDCRRVKPVYSRTDEGRARCAGCDKRARAEPCGTCGRVKSVARRAVDGSARCSGCARRDTSAWEDCAGCGRRRPVNARAEDGGALCVSCYLAPPAVCAACGETKPVASRRGGGPLCAGCYRQPERECGGCGRIRRIAVRGRNGQPDLCGSCHQAPVLVCGVCGVEGPCRTTTIDRSPICFRCQLVRRLDQLLTGPSGQIAGSLVPLRDAILSVDNPRTALDWLRRSPAVEVLTAMAKGHRPLAHATLDDAAGTRRGRAFAIEHLRQLLVTCGALPERDRHLARLEVALQELVEAAHPEDQEPLRTYATWWLLHRLRRKAEQGRPPLSSLPTGSASRLPRPPVSLAWLREQRRTLSGTVQGDLDAWLTIRPQARRRLPGFLRWAQTRGFLAGLDAAYPPASDPLSFVCDDQRWGIARRLLTDDSVETRDRVAALLLVLYAQPAARIVRLTRASIQIEGHDIRLQLGEDRVLLPSPLSELIQRLPEQAPAGMARNLADDDLWLFPGRRPGHPMSPTTMSTRLRNLGIEPRAARNTALLQLGAELPSVVLADLLGVHVNTAERWNAAAGGRWTTYASTRHRHAESR
ncbi:hypothetical protein [Nocardioides sp. TF02-7]|uniref:hypothetical protein n=1 Tax=Nocardioides sp. TF02-7 TaxID=2917724 RepID=UPI001F05265C|nr:hypothetical protein [Nocardioides sp. TF02-7]UMG92882.1 hypothetical protein MF408_00355 [Nocardioides sp. TF02-7]